MRVKLEQGAEGAPNFCFGVYATTNEAGYRTGDCVEFIQSDWEYAPLASQFGWIPCRKCGATDGTVDCPHRNVSEMLSEAFDFLEARDGRTFEWNE